MPVSEEHRQALARYLAKNLDTERARKLAYYHAHGDELRHKQRERYHVKKAQRLAAIRLARIVEECRIEQIRILAAPHTTQISATSS